MCAACASTSMSMSNDDIIDEQRRWWPCSGIRGCKEIMMTTNENPHTHAPASEVFIQDDVIRDSIKPAATARM